MAKFRKKPVVIEATQWFYGDSLDGVCYESVCGHVEPHVHTLEGSHIISDGDWLITGIKNEKYPCKDEIFRLTYERVD
jgi:hypothetical protein